VFLLFGSRVSQQIVNVVAFVCGYCNVDAPQHVVKSSNKFTLFFVPLFTFSTKYHNECTNCGGRTALTPEQVQHSLRLARN
jgi:Zn ribbon nucleic-acid-binding protein